MTEWFIYNNAELYGRALDAFHKKYVRHLLMNGAGPAGMPINEVKMTKHPESTYSFCNQVMSKLLKTKPHTVGRLIEDNKIIAENIFIQCLGYNEYDNFMIQYIPVWLQDKFCSYQIWYVNPASKQDIKDFWHNA